MVFASLGVLAAAIAVAFGLSMVLTGIRSSSLDRMMPGLEMWIGAPPAIFGLATGVPLVLFLIRGGKRLLLAAVVTAAGLLIVAGLILLVLFAPEISSIR